MDDNKNSDFDNLAMISSHDIVKVTKMNHIVEVQYMAKMNRSCHIQKLDKDTYADLHTGEIKSFEHIENRKDSLNSLRQTFKKLRYLINNNFIGSANELHVVLTYAENMTDTKRLYKDFQNFIDRLRYKFKDKTDIDYLSVVEPQGRGAWHLHVLMRFNRLEGVYIANNDLFELWGHGFVVVRALKDIDNIGAYLSAYLSDIEITSENAISIISHQRTLEIKEITGSDKKIIKGGRLHMYPRDMKLYRASRGIKAPKREEMLYKDIKKIVGSAKTNYQKEYTVEHDEFFNRIVFHQYNLKRK